MDGLGVCHPDRESVWMGGKQDTEKDVKIERERERKEDINKEMKNARKEDINKDMKKERMTIKKERWTKKQLMANTFINNNVSGRRMSNNEKCLIKMNERKVDKINPMRNTLRNK